MYKRVYRSNQYSKMFQNFINLLKENIKNSNPINIEVDMRTDKSLIGTESFEDYKKVLDFYRRKKYIANLDMMIGQEKILPKHLIGNMKIRNMLLSMRFRYSPCFEYFNGPHVYWNGDVGICGCRDVDAKELIIGDVNKTKLVDIWYNELHLKYLNNFLKNTPTICSKCTHYDNISYFKKTLFNFK